MIGAFPVSIFRLLGKSDPISFRDRAIPARLRLG